MKTECFKLLTEQQQRQLGPGEGVDPLLEGAVLGVISLVMQPFIEIL